MSSGQFNSFLGPLKFKYREPDFLNCHVYLLAKALSFIEPPEEKEFQPFEIDPKQDPNKILLDAIGALTGRGEQTEAVKLSPRILDRVPEWAFLRSFAALEALYSKETVALTEVKTTVKEPEKTPAEIKPTGICLDALYGSINEENSAVEIDLPPQASQSTLSQKTEATQFKTGKNRTDPFDLLQEYVEREIEPLRDSFEILVAHLGF